MPKIVKFIIIAFFTVCIVVQALDNDYKHRELKRHFEEQRKKLHDTELELFRVKNEKDIQAQFWHSAELELWRLKNERLLQTPER